jgi:hypothetical protein
MEYTDIDQLERVVHILSHGDLQAENTRQLTETNFIKIFRLAQLAIQYLLHVQDVLSSERSELLKTECVPCLELLVAAVIALHCSEWQDDAVNVCYKQAFT